MSDRLRPSQQSITYRSAARTITATTEGTSHDTFERSEALAGRWGLDRSTAT